LDDIINRKARQIRAFIRHLYYVDPLAEKRYSISPYAYCAGNPVNRIDPDGRDDTSGTPSKKKKNGVDTTPQSTTAVNTPKKFEPVKRTTQNNAPAKTAGGNKKADPDPTITAKNHQEIVNTDFIKAETYGTTELHKGKDNVELIKEANTNAPEAEVTTNYGIKVAVSKKGEPTLSGTSAVSVGTDGNSIILDISQKIPFTSLGCGITISINPNNLLPAAVTVPIANAAEQIENLSSLICS